MSQYQLLTKPDGNILETITDPRVIAASLGAAGGAALEKFAFVQPAVRSFVGFATEKDGTLVVLKPDKDGKPDTAAGHQQNLFTQRQLARLGAVALCVTGIEFIGRGVKDDDQAAKKAIGNTQYALMGAAVGLTARIVLDILPGLQFPARK